MRILPSTFRLRKDDLPRFHGRNRQGRCQTKSRSNYGGKSGTTVEADFWDASALVPPCVRQSITPHAVAYYKAYEAIVWWVTPVEIASAGETVS